MQSLLKSPEEFESHLASVEASGGSLQSILDQLVAAVAWAKENFPAMLAAFESLLAIFQAKHPNIKPSK